MSEEIPWLANRVASIVPNVLASKTAQACVPPSDRFWSSWRCSSGSTTCPGGCCKYCWHCDCNGANCYSYVCGPC